VFENRFACVHKVILTLFHLNSYPTEFTPTARVGA
jgi:hypothetical protein